MKTLKQIALDYVGGGLCILPTHNNLKYPPFLWEKYKTTKSTRSQIERWFDNPQTTGIAVVCGEISSITVIDDDGYNKGKKYLNLHSGLESKTASGGRHIFFKYSPWIENRNIRNEDHDFDVQNNGKLIILPPSKVLNKDKKIASYEWVRKDIVNVAGLPQIASDFTAKYQEHTTTTNIDYSDLLEIPIGNQHNSLRDLTNKLLFSTKQESWQTIKSYIYGVSEKYNPPHPRKRVDALWRDCIKFVVSRKLEKKTPRTLSQISVERHKELVYEKNAPSTGYTRLDNLIKGFVSGHLYVFTGDTNVGKTSVSANFAVTLAENNRKVLYFALEPANTVIDYLSSVAYECEFGEIEKHYTNKNILVYTQEQISTLQQLTQSIKNLPRQDLIIIDHIGYFHKATGTNGNFYQAQSDSIKELVQLAKTKKTAILIIAHVRKDYKTKTPTLNDISGSGAFKQDATDVVIVLRDKQNEYKYTNTGSMIVAKTKSGPSASLRIKFKRLSAKIYEEEKGWIS